MATTSAPFLASTTLPTGPFRFNQHNHYANPNLNNLPNSNNNNTCRAFLKAAERGQLSRLQANLRILRPSFLTTSNTNQASSPPNRSTTTTVTTWPLLWVRALQAAASRGHVSIVRYLLSLAKQQQQQQQQEGVPSSWVLSSSSLRGTTDEQQGSSYTALQLAASQGHDAVVRLLLEHNDGDDDDGDHVLRDMIIALDLAVRRGHIHVVQTLVEHGDGAGDAKNLLLLPLSSSSNRHVTTTTPPLPSPAHTAVVYCQRKCLEYLVAQAPELLYVAATTSVEVTAGHTILHTAAALGHVGMVEWILSKHQQYYPDDVPKAAMDHHPQQKDFGVPMQLHNHVTGDTPLHVAIQHGHLRVVKALLTARGGRHRVAGMDDTSGQPQPQNANTPPTLEHATMATAANWQGETPMHWAVRKNAMDHCEELLSHCKMMKSKDYATTVCKLLFKATDEGGQTPLHWAVQRGHLQLAQWLARQELELSLISSSTNPANVDSVMNTGNSTGIDSTETEAMMTVFFIHNYPRTKIGYTLLHLAAAGGHGSVVQWLIDVCGVDPFPQSSSHSHKAVTPWGLASLAGHDSVAYYLLRYNPMAALFFYPTTSLGDEKAESE